MAIRLPLKTAFTLTDSATSSVATGTIATFTLPQDTDNAVLKLQASVIGGGVSAYVQTTDDGGTTYYDVGRTSVISAGTQWLSLPIISAGTGTGFTSIVGTTQGTPAIGSANASTVGIRQMTGLPLLSPQGRVVLSYSAAGTSNTTVVAEVKVNSQSATA